jgi:hypothetical protein
MKMDVTICCARIPLAVTYLTVAAASAGIVDKPHPDTYLRDGDVCGWQEEKPAKPCKQATGMNAWERASYSSRNCPLQTKSALEKNMAN